MNGNPFYVAPLGGQGGEIAQQLSGLGQVLEQKRLKDEALNLQKRKEAKDIALRQKAQEVYSTGNPDEIATFMFQNPELADGLTKAVNYKNNDTKRNMLESMQRVVAGEDPAQVIQDRAALVQKHGGDPTQTLAELEKYQADPEGYKQIVEKSYAAHFPKEYQEFKKATEKKYEQGTGDAAGRAFDPTTGSFIGEPIKPKQEFTGAYGNLALSMFGTKDSSKLQPEQMQALDAEARARQLERPPSTNVTVQAEQKGFQNEQDLRKEFTAHPTVKNFKEVQFAHDQIRTALSKPTAANDLAAATKFMKILDPGSVVRESELGLAMEATGKIDKITNYYNRLKTGEKLTQAQRKDFLQAADGLLNAAKERYDPVSEQFSEAATAHGINPDLVLGKSAPKAPTAPVVTQSDVNGFVKKYGGTPEMAAQFLKSKGHAVK